MSVIQVFLKIGGYGETVRSFRFVSSILWVSTVEGCLLSGVPLYVISIKYNFSFSFI